jgi:hypothetical protein
VRSSAKAISRPAPGTRVGWTRPLEEAEFLCRRYGYLDEKLRELTAGIRAALSLGRLR